jgi:hypothetical protein
MSAMIERVARAVADAFMEDYDEAPNLYDAMAEAAIAAMREFKMVVRHDGEVVHELRGAPDDIWKAMIDAALDKAAA